MPNPVNPVNPVEKRPNAWRRTARFANRNDGIMVAQRTALSRALGEGNGAQRQGEGTLRFANRGYGIHGFAMHPLPITNQRVSVTLFKPRGVSGLWPAASAA
jgi:hypothetical protein